ncbi:MAG: hypothetical protein DMF73_14200 [Acidobacteria bacterium]|nr:MAG: hypothetical protein DMF73_14200 [Acidobacteriota bacterium]
MRTARFVTRVITFIAVCSAAAFPTSAQQKPDDVVRVNTELVQTDFMVFDKQGNFVDALKRDQFVLKVEGKPRPISFFDRLAVGSRSEEAQLAAARGSSANGAGRPVPLDRGRTVMFFIDDLHLSAGSTTYTRQMLKRFIDLGATRFPATTDGQQNCAEIRRRPAAGATGNTAVRRVPAHDRVSGNSDRATRY